MSFVDPYFDKNIGDLRNLLGAKSSKELKELEPQIVFANELELESIAIPRTNDFAELLLIHKQLFKGVYDWAGHPYAGYFEIADTVESARDSGKWKATGGAFGYTVDGIHPSPTGHAAMATAITTAVFAL